MNKILFGCSAVMLAIFAATGANAGPIHYTLSNVTFDDGAALTGDFTIDHATGDLISFDILAADGDLPAYEYVTGYSTIRDKFVSNQYLFFSSSFTRYVTFAFVGPLGLGSNAIVVDPFGPSSFECDNCLNVRLVTSGVAIGNAVPEPSSWAMMLSGFAAIGGAIRARHRMRVRFA